MRAVQVVRVEYQTGEEQCVKPSFLFVDRLTNQLYFTHGAACALSKHSYLSLLSVGAGRLKVGDKRQRTDVRSRRILKHLQDGRAGMQQAHVVEMTRMGAQHGAEWCRVSLQSSHEESVLVNCVRVDLCGFNTKTLSRALEFLLVRMGNLYPNFFT